MVKATLGKAGEHSVTLRCKVAVVGDSAVGKTALCQMFQSKGTLFPKNYKLTAGVELVVGSATIEGTTTVVEQYLHDSGGQQIFTDWVPKYWNDISTVMLVYDITRQETFQALNKWLDLLKTHRTDKGQSIMGVVVGNKKDLDIRRQVPRAQAEDWARGQGLEFCEVSAMPPTAKDYDKGFLLIAEQLRQQYETQLTGMKQALQH
eukprot:CAMPEP_0117663690 /NCGR_PEP_ID=MMETSP0804-20121206/8761_1 /TAXON_ID=1074897 /ORGANISM="Tetraselmis astigmatica, Strain CCMP880" /LENGTH=204 /DNA_ID=CAMNT_0005470753 /DNA_START=84 /DNA_END=698 /DNA_ORIENTATION=+